MTCNYTHPVPVVKYLIFIDCYHGWSSAPVDPQDGFGLPSGPLRPAPASGPMGPVGLPEMPDKSEPMSTLDPWDVLDQWVSMF